jgi:hypothetical protein
MRYLPHSPYSPLESSSYVARRRETIDFEATGGERYFEHDVEARPLARIYQFPQRFTTRHSLRLQRKA